MSLYDGAKSGVTLVCEWRGAEKLHVTFPLTVVVVVELPLVPEDDPR